MTDDLPVPIDSEGSIRFRMEEVLMSLWPRLLLCVGG